MCKRLSPSQFDACVYLEQPREWLTFGCQAPPYSMADAHCRPSVQAIDSQRSSPTLVPGHYLMSMAWYMTLHAPFWPATQEKSVSNFYHQEVKKVLCNTKAKLLWSFMHMCSSRAQICQSSFMQYYCSNIDAAILMQDEWLASSDHAATTCGILCCSCKHLSAQEAVL